MSTQQVNNESLQAQRILTNCKKIWGADKEFNIDLDCDGPWGDCQAFVREDGGLTLGPMLTMTNVCHGSKRAWNELDRMLRLWAQQVESGRPLSQEEALDIFSKPSGENRAVLGQFMTAVARGGVNAVHNPELADEVAKAVVMGATFIDDAEGRFGQSLAEENTHSGTRRSNA